jgi:putative nucleotidyltransferase with HDIG domain
MAQPNKQQIVARQVERIVRQLTSLSTLPQVAANLLSQITDGAFDPAQLAENIQSDPALTAKVLLLAHREGIQFSHEPTVVEAVAKLPAALLREAVISVKVFQVAQLDDDADAQRILPRRGMALHSLAVACCAQDIAERILPPEQRQTAYLAGLLHDLGKCALDEVMPKSLERMVIEARTSKVSLTQVEQRHLGLDHTVLGKRLAQKWHLPEAVISAIWLHHCDGQTLAADLPNVEMVRVVALADRIARTRQLGASGSFDKPEGIAEIAELLNLTASQIDEIQSTLAEKVKQKTAMLGFDQSDSPGGYYNMIRQTAADLASDNRKLSESSGQHRQLNNQVSLIGDYLGELDENAAPLDLAQNLVTGWQKTMQTGSTAVYVVPDSTEPYVDLVAADRQGKQEIRAVQMPNGIPPIPEVFQRKQAIVPVADGAKWLSEQLSADFNPEMLYMAPLRMADKVVAVLIFEVFSKQNELLESDHALLACKVAAASIAMALEGQKHLELAERFVQLMSTLRQTRTELAKSQSLAGLAEMAAGAAHELNNPLAVISGRAQLLTESEEDDEKKQMLTQITERTEEIKQIVNDLMSFAKPKDPEKRAIAITELIGKVIEKTAKAAGLETLEAEVTGADTAGSVYVDVHQMTQAMCFVLTNALQSYPNENGPVRLACSVADDTNAAIIAISDSGCGMDIATLEKATQPFFSYRPAGRKRGMGLAHAQRLLILNGGAITLESQPEQGTTVTLILPKV